MKRFLYRSFLTITSVICAAVVLMPDHASAADPSTPHVCLAGTFNGWDPTDKTTRFEEIDGRLELSRFWRCGSHEFKFAFDGAWTRHLGEGDDGRLTQPGRNIHLVIPQSAEYTLWLSLKDKRWGFEPRTAARPHAVIRLHDVHSGRVTLDAGASVSRENHPIQAYQWRVRRLASVDSTSDDDQTWKPKSAPIATYVVERPGLYEIELTLSDGKYRDSARITRELHPGWRMRYQPADEAPSDAESALPLGDGVWGWVFLPTQDGEARLHIESGTTGPPQKLEGKRTVRTRKGHRTLAKLSTRTGELTLHEDGWHTFQYEPAGDDRLPAGLAIEKVELLGDFNGWRPGATPMISTEAGRVYRAILELPDGAHHYKFLVNGAYWLEDTAADPSLRQPNKTGGYNSGVRIGPDAEQLGPPLPNHIVRTALKHDPTRSTYFTPISENLVRLTCRTLADDVERVAVIPLKSGVFQYEGGGPIPMHRTDSRNGFDYWSLQARVKSRTMPYESPTCRGGMVKDEMTVAPWLQYAFLITDGWERLIVGQDHTETRPWSQVVRPPFQTPEWARQAVWYQIFPERFRNGDSSNDPPRTVPWTHAWNKPYGASKAKGSPDPDFVERGSFYQYIYDRRYGGDIQGIHESLPYLRDLGITAIYLNPVFLAESLHKYDASDYRHIDDFFGVAGSLKKIEGETADPKTWQWSESDRVFLAFLDEAHRLGFKVIIDGVFNHTGRDFWAFRDVLKNGQKSPYADWFDIISWKPLHYLAWDRKDGALPRLKHDEALGLARPVRDHLFAITRRWMDPNGDGNPSDGIDGWRLDVASDINANFWRDWRTLVKTINPDAYIVAELWQNSADWLNGQTFDAVMHYPFARSCQRFFVNKKRRITSSRFRDELQATLAWYPPQVNHVLQNLFDSHDTDRAASMFMNPDLEYDQANRIQDNGPNYNLARPTPDCYKRLKLMVTFQMTYLGAPMIYYGDEAGMYGADDPNDRKPMLWSDRIPYDDPNDRIEQDVFDHYQRMIAIRNSLPPLQLGSFRPLLADDDRGVFAFARSLDAETVVVVLNNSDKAYELEVPAPWPNGTSVVQMDNPKAYEIVSPSKKNPASRPSVRPVQGQSTSLKVMDSRLRGTTLAPYTGGIFIEQ